MWYPNRDAIAYHDFYMSKYLTPRYIRLKPEGRSKEKPRYNTLPAHERAGENFYAPFKFKKRYKVVIEPWGNKNICPNRYK